MQVFLKKGGIREIGGWLVAEQIAPGYFELVGFTVDLEGGTRDRFRSLPSLHTEQLDQILLANGNRVGRVDYLGEWHSHPTFPPVPSKMDLSSMINMVENSGPSFAALVIVRLLDTFSIESTITTFQRGQSPIGGRLLIDDTPSEKLFHD
ncbi:Mov34/MPN/PAD-1 family protein [Oceaniovalibus sp. ACAM 378]|uniref:Mov34/MPN/PAD-1 family protein n=1 Tax=Oceaniovalibus sp. ACAM 378 TaxID=2599923 RepID=UPI00165268A4|nr:Mov34/MPN/PAD-1 family protein [Oceaniovalibus sp. ACAM 378]